MNCSRNICRYLRRNFMNRGENICRYIRSLRFHTSCKCECAPSVGMVDTNCSVIDFQKIKMEKSSLYISKKTLEELRQNKFDILFGARE